MLKGDRYREWHGLLPRRMPESLDASHAEVKGGSPAAVVSPASEVSDHQGVDRLAGRRGRSHSQGGSRAAPRGRTHAAKTLAVAGTRRPCAKCMIPLESPVPEIGTPGSGSGGLET